MHMARVSIFLIPYSRNGFRPYRNFATQEPRKTRGTADRAPGEDAAAGITATGWWISVCRYKASALAQNLTTIDRKRPKSHGISVIAVGSGPGCSIAE
jgi:hypothetical protein